MKKLLPIVLTLAAVCALSPPAQAQNYQTPPTALNGGTNNVATATTNSTVGIVMLGTRTTVMGVQATFRLNGAGTDNIVFKFDHSIDGASWKAAGTTLTIAATGTNLVTGNASIALGGIGYVRLQTIENPSSSSVTNLVFKYSAKNGL